MTVSQPTAAIVDAAVQFIRDRVNTSQMWLEDAILAIDARQTADERSTGNTIHLNGQGWNGRDANFGSSLARFIRNSRYPVGQRLTRKQVDKGRPMMHKYAGQLLRIWGMQRVAAA